MKDEKMILYVQTSNAPERQYAPLVLAQTAKAMDLNPVVYYVCMGLTVLMPGEMEKMQLGSFPSVKEMMDKTLEMGNYRKAADEGGFYLRGFNYLLLFRRRREPSQPAK